MFEHLKGKKLLYLGGIKRAAYVVQRAKTLGIYVIVADYNIDSPAKEVADEGVLISAVDVDALVALCREKKIDGVMTGYADILMPICYQICGILDLPCYFTEAMLSASTDKGFFKEMCVDSDVPVPATYDVTAENYKTVYRDLHYPVFIKPLDASGSRGADVCHSAEEFTKKYEYALSFSKKRSVTVEQYLCGTEFILDYLILNGRPYLLSMADRYTVEGRGAAINSPNLMILPSANLQRYAESIDGKVRKMFVKNGFKDGLIFLQGYAGESDITFYEMGCRLGGTWPYIDEYFTGHNPMDLLFNQALSGHMLDEEYEKDISPDFHGKAAIIYFLANCTSGTVNKVVGIEETEKYPGVVDVMQFYGPGDDFDNERQTDIRFSSVHLVADDMSLLKQRVRDIYAMVDYLDENGNSLLCEKYDIDLINE